MMTIQNVPLTILNRALELYGEPAADTSALAWDALRSAEGRLDASGPYTPFAQAVAEYMSLSGPWSEDGGEHAGESGYSVTQ